LQRNNESHDTGSGRGGVLREASLGFWLAIAAASGAMAGPIHEDDKQICAWAVGTVERIYRLPDRLMAAIALAESGRPDGEGRRYFAWPWTVRAEGNDRFFGTKAAAAAEIMRLRRAGVTNIDVGCMQVNLQYHPNAFASPEQALDPVENAEYAAFHLVELHERTRSWSRAVASYHSGRRVRGRNYWRRVARIWQAERRRAFREALRERDAIANRTTGPRALRLGAMLPYAPLDGPIVLRP